MFLVPSGFVIILQWLQKQQPGRQQSKSLPSVIDTKWLEQGPEAQETSAHFDLLGGGVVPGKYGKMRGCPHLFWEPTLGGTLKKEADARGRLVREKWAPGAADSVGQHRQSGQAPL